MNKKIGPSSSMSFRGKPVPVKKDNRTKSTTPRSPGSGSGIPGPGWLGKGK